MLSIKQRLKSGEVVIGSWMQIPDGSVAEIMGQAGFDWIAVDLEHGLFGENSLADVCRAIELGGAVPFVRVAQCGGKEIKHALEAGARGLIVPMVQSREQVEQAIKWACYPPEGERGVGYSRANLFGKHFSEYFANVNQELVIVAQIESIGAVRQIDAIASTPGLDALLIGPYDLSASMGLTGQFDHPDFLKALNETATSASHHRVPMGLHIVKPNVTLLNARITEGYRFIAYGIDAVFLTSAAENPLRRSV